MKDICGTRLRLLIVPADLLFDARPADGSFFPRFDLGTDDGERVQLFELARPDRTSLRPMEPLLWVGSDHQRARKVRHPFEARLGIALRYRLHPSFDDPPDLLRGLHAGKSPPKHPAAQRDGSPRVSTSKSLACTSVLSLERQTVPLLPQPVTAS